MDFTETRVAEVRYYGTVNEHEASEMIQTQSIYFFVSLKTTKKERKKRNEKICPHLELIAAHLNSRHGQYHCAMSTLDDQWAENKHAYYYKTADNSVGSSL